MKEPLFKIKIITKNIIDWELIFSSMGELIFMNFLPFGGREVRTEFVYASIENNVEHYKNDKYSYHILIIDDEEINPTGKENIEKYYDAPKIIIWNKDNIR